MKNRLRNSLLVIVGIICILPISIKAETKATCKSLSVVRDTGVHANISGVHDGNLFDMRMGNNKALCLEPGKSASVRFEYGSKDGESNHPMIMKAVAYAEAAGSNYKKLLTAQIVAWVYGKNPSASTEELKRALVDAYFQNKNVVGANGERIFDGNEEEEYNSFMAFKGASEYCIFTSSGTVQNVAVKKVGGSCNFDCTKTNDKCPKYDVDTTDGGAAECQNSGKNSKVVATEIFGVKGKESGDSSINQYGRLIDGIPNGNKYCKLYCDENVTIILPGAPQEIKTGQLVLTWPTSKDEEVNNNIEGANKYPLIFKGKKTCSIYVSSDKMPCSYQPIVNKYSINYEYVINHSNKELEFCSSVGGLQG